MKSWIRLEHSLFNHKDLYKLWDCCRRKERSVKSITVSRNRKKKLFKKLSSLMKRRKSSSRSRIPWSKLFMKITRALCATATKGKLRSKIWKNTNNLPPIIKRTLKAWERTLIRRISNICRGRNSLQTFKSTNRFWLMYARTKTWDVKRQVKIRLHGLEADFWTSKTKTRN